MNIKINLNIFPFLILFFLTNQLEIYILIMIFALIHEIGHLLCGVMLGYNINTLEIMPLGFCINFKININIKDYNKKIIKSNVLSLKNIIIALAGPFTNLIIIVVGFMHNLNENIIYSNLLIMLFNLIPIYPLDGGKVLKNTFKILVGNRKANKYMNTISNLFAIIVTMLSSILILMYKNIAIFAIVIVIWVMVIKQNKMYSTYNKIYKTIDKNYNYL